MQEQKFKLTSAVKNNSARGTALLEKAKSLAHKDKLDSIKGLAEILKSEDLSLDQVKELYAFLNKAQSKYNPNKRLQGNNLDADSAAFLAAGGSSGLAWCKLVLKEAGVLNSLTKDIQKAETEVEEDLKGIEIKVAKSVNTELKQVTYVAMKPGVDLHGDYVDLETIRLAKESFNRQLKKSKMANLFHLTMSDSFDIIESYLSPTDMTLNGHFVEKGEWLMTLQILDDSLWEMIKNDEVTGISIGAMANVLDVKDEDGTND